MKKFLAILLTFSLLLSTTGLIVVTHYCGWKCTTGISFGIKAEHSCCCKKPMTKNCCRNHIKVLKITTDYNKSVQSNFFSFTPFDSLTITSCNILLKNPAVSLRQFFIYESPPLCKYRTVLYSTLLI